MLPHVRPHSPPVTNDGGENSRETHVRSADELLRPGPYGWFRSPDALGDSRSPERASSGHTAEGQRGGRAPLLQPPSAIHWLNGLLQEEWPIRNRGLWGGVL